MMYLPSRAQSSIRILKSIGSALFVELSVNLGLCIHTTGLKVTFTPLKINMQHNSEGLEDDFPFQTGGF